MGTESDNAAPFWSPEMRRVARVMAEAMSRKLAAMPASEAAALLETKVSDMSKEDLADLCRVPE